jgi:hypothetical protein
MRSQKLDEPVTDKFEARSIFEAGWLAMRAWSRLWFWDSECRFPTVRRGEQSWRVPMDKIRKWQPPPDVMEMVERRGLS